MYESYDWFNLRRTGLRGLKLSYLIKNLVIPVCTGLGLALSVPYILAHSVAPLFISDSLILVMVQRRIYPFLLLFLVTVALTIMQLKQFKKLYEHIKNDKYLVGRRLVNYNHQASSSSSESTTAAS